MDSGLEHGGATTFHWLLVGSPTVCDDHTRSCPLPSDGSPGGRSDGWEAGEGSGSLCPSAGDHASAKVALFTEPPPPEAWGHRWAQLFRHPTCGSCCAETEMGQAPLSPDPWFSVVMDRGGNSFSVTAPWFQARWSHELFINLPAVTLVDKFSSEWILLKRGMLALSVRPPGNAHAG